MNEKVIDGLFYFLICVAVIVGFLLGMQLGKEETVENTYVENKHLNETKLVYNRTIYQKYDSVELDEILRYVRQKDIVRTIEPSKICARSPRLHELPKAVGWSMGLTITPNDIPLGKRYSTKDELVQGELILYNYNGKKVLHRICGLYDDYISTCSDNLDVRHQINYTDVEYVVCGVYYR